jgi:hypothetical protein
MVRMRLEAWFEHSESFAGIADRILLPNAGSERQTVEGLGLHIIRVSSVQSAHSVGVCVRSPFILRRVGVQVAA